MFNKILIIGCGLIGSSILRAVIDKKISRKIYILEKSKKNISKIKKINSNLKFLNKIDKNVSSINFVILCTPMSEYEKIILKLNNFLSPHTLLTDVGSTKKNLLELKNKKFNKKLNWIMSHPISGSEVSGPEHGKQDMFDNKWCILIKDKSTNYILS